MTQGPVRELILIGHGMVGQHLLEMLAERGALVGGGSEASGPWRVTVLAEEDIPAYDRLHLSSLFSGTGADALRLGPPDFLDRHGVRLLLGEAAERIDTAARTVHTARGRTLRYDALVLATGSVPFVPPVPGADAEGCFTYRTLDDARALRAYAEGRATGVVIGGGLLGLEAVGALRSLDLAPCVVESAERLMPLHVDDGGAAALRGRVEALGVAVHTGVAARRVVVDGAGRVAAVELADGQRIVADLVVFAAGIRPRDGLARAAGLGVRDGGGIAVDASCRTSDPAVYAVGECARFEGAAVCGMLAPGYRMAETLAAVLAGAPEPQPGSGADGSARLKLLGVEVASFGDPFASQEEGAVAMVSSDVRSGVYKKVLLGPDGVLLGGVLVGDTAAYGTLQAYTGRELPGRPGDYLAPGAAGGSAAPGELPDDAVVCSCHHVTKGQVTRVVQERGLSDVDGIKQHTRAGSSCGGCLPALETLLEGELRARSAHHRRRLCEHFELSRPEIYALVRDERIRSFSELVARHGSGEGCAVCKPVVANILATLAPELGLSHILEGEQAALQDSNDLFLANLQKDGTYSVVPRIPGGVISAAKLVVLGEVAEEFGLFTKITGGQRIDLFGATAEQLPLIWRRLVDAGFESGHAYGKSLRTMKSCVGARFCRFGQGDTMRLAIDLELRYRGLRAPHKIKGGVSGCLRECAEARGKDIGVIAVAGGWNLYVGGNGGSRPRQADLLAKGLTQQELVRLLDRFLMYYVRTADRMHRTATWIDRLDGGVEHLREVLVEDSLGLCADLEAQMERHVAAYRDEWRAVLDDPAALSRFGAVDFGAAPDVLEPGRGRAVVLPDGRETAMFKTRDGQVYAMDNTDPVSGAKVMANGIVGDKDGVPVVTSPMYKQVYDLRTGREFHVGRTMLPVIPLGERPAGTSRAAPR
ncbi:nitrite reductase large subunit NirB [Streptomyces sp. NPDC059009]|uniref:nitrite reductase large subunit NirB n=1 Tax=Streptomyces sp. NPDC059009 TaxID=3346694 RepID=UPI0036BCCC7B